jgi:hypothetical protein
MKKLIVSHIRNEEYLLPFWLKHHKKYFDHGVIVDYNSSDNSVNVIKEICPTWEVVPSRFERMSTFQMDTEIEDIESQYPGWWKMCLSTTEFLIGDYNKLDTQTDPNSFHLIPAFQMVDSLEEEGSYPDSNIEIFNQRVNGIHYNDTISYPPTKFLGHDEYENKLRTTMGDGWSTRRARILHNMDRIKYSIGRHYTDFDNISKDFIIAYYRFSPFNETTLNRIVGIQENLTEFDKTYGLGFEHFLGKPEQINWFKSWQSNTRDLSLDLQYFINLLPKN